MKHLIRTLVMHCWGLQPSPSSFLRLLPVFWCFRGTWKASNDFLSLRRNSLLDCFMDRSESPPPWFSLRLMTVKWFRLQEIWSQTGDQPEKGSKLSTLMHLHTWDSLRDQSSRYDYHHIIRSELLLKDAFSEEPTCIYLLCSDLTSCMSACLKQTRPHF